MLLPTGAGTCHAVARPRGPRGVFFEWGQVFLGRWRRGCMKSRTTSSSAAILGAILPQQFDQSLPCDHVERRDD